MSDPTIAPFGAWNSPIDAAAVADMGVGSNLPLTELKLAEGEVAWIERRPSEGGRQVIVQILPDGSCLERTPQGYNARTTVHEYGGGSYCHSAGVFFFSNFEDQRIYRAEVGKKLIPVTPEGQDPQSIRYADSILSPNGDWLIAVGETHLAEGEVRNELVAIPSDGSGAPKVLASGHDFYASPRTSPDGGFLAWLSWDQPQMPWNGTTLSLATLTRECDLADFQHVAGGSSVSIFQPEWGPDGVLHFISDENGWWNIYKHVEGAIQPVFIMEADIGYPQWLFGLSRYTFLSDGRIAFIYTSDGEDQIGLFDPQTHSYRTIGLPFTSYTQPYLQCDSENMLWALAGNAYEVPSVVRIDPVDERFELVKPALKMTHDRRYITPPESIEFATKDGGTAHAFFYRPKNPDFQAPEEERPPLIVKSHGGPTSAARCHLQLEIQYWTSRGFAVVDVNYGGSTGFGREFRERLEGNWGIVDTDDCISAALYLVEQGVVDKERLIIRGGSAGGFTTLSALTFHDIFAAGASYYGVADLKSLSEFTHKFEAHYLDRMVGPLPEAEELYFLRSPINFTKRLSCPMILFQGLEDAVVPPAQAEDMIKALNENKLPYAYVAFENERHGFRIKTNVIHSLQAEYSFYAQIFGFQPGERIDPVEIHNLA